MVCSQPCVVPIGLVALVLRLRLMSIRLLLITLVAIVARDLHRELDSRERKGWWSGKGLCRSQHHLLKNDVMRVRLGMMLLVVVKT